MLKAWTLFLKKPESPGIINLENKIKEIKEAKDELTEISADEKNRELYEMREAALHDRISALSGAKKKGIELGLKKAQEEVIKAKKREAQAQKREQQAQKEKEDAQNKLKNTVLQMLKDKLSLELISKYTGLSIEEVMLMRKEVEGFNTHP